MNSLDHMFSDERDEPFSVGSNGMMRSSQAKSSHRRMSSDEILIEELRKVENGGDMLNWALTFLVVALIAGVFGFTGIAGTAAGMAKILFMVFLVLFVISLVVPRLRPPVA